MQQALKITEGQSSVRRNSLFSAESLKAFNSYNELLLLVREGSQKSIPEEFQQKAMRLLKSHKCNHDNLTNFTPDQIEEYYLQVIQNLSLVHHEGPKIIDPQLTKNLYVVLFGDLMIYAPKLNEGKSNLASPLKQQPHDQQQIKSFMSLNLHEEGEISKNINHHYEQQQQQHNPATSQEELLLKNYEPYKKLQPGQLFGDIKQIPELPRKHVCYITDKAILAEITKKDMDIILKTYMKELYFKVNQLKILLPNLSKELSQKSFVKDQIIYTEGSEATCIYIIKEGQVTFLKAQNENNQSDKQEHIPHEQNVQDLVSDQSHQVLMKQKVNKKQIELTKISGGQIFGNDEIILEIPRQNTAKVSSVILEVYELKKELLFSFIQKTNQNQNENGQTYIDKMKRHSLKKQDFYENTIVVNKKKIQSIVELQRRISSPQIQRGLSGILSNEVKQQKMQKSQIIIKNPTKTVINDQQIRMSAGSPKNSNQNFLNATNSEKNQNSIKLEYFAQPQSKEISKKDNDVIYQRPHSNSQSEGISQTIYEQGQHKYSSAIKSSANLSSNNQHFQVKRVEYNKNKSKNNSKQLAGTDEIQQLVQQNKQFMQQTGQNTKKFGFDNPLFNEMDQSHQSRIRKINQDYLKMKDPKKYREKPMYQQNQTAQKLITNMLNLTKRASQNLQTAQMENKEKEEQQQMIYTMNQTTSILGSPRIEKSNNYTNSPNNSNTIIGNNNNSNNLINSSNSINQNQIASSSSTNKAFQQNSIKYFQKSKFLMNSNDSPMMRQIEQSNDSPIQVNSLISSFRDSPIHKKFSYADSKIQSPQNSQQKNELHQQIYNGIASSSKFSQRVSKLSDSRNLCKVDEAEKLNNTDNQATPTTQEILQPHKMSDRDLSDDRISQEKVKANIRKSQGLQIQIPASDVGEQQEDIHSVKSSYTVYYYQHCNKNRLLTKNSMNINQSHNLPIKVHPQTTINTPIHQHHHNQKISFSQFTDQNTLTNQQVPKSQSLGRKLTPFDQKDEQSAQIDSKLTNQTFSQLFCSTQAQANQVNKSYINDQVNDSKLNQSQINQQIQLQQLNQTQNSKSFGSIPRLMNNLNLPLSQQNQNNMFIQNIPQSHLIFSKASMPNQQYQNSPTQSQSQILQHRQRVLFKNSGNQSQRAAEFQNQTMVQQPLSAKNKGPLNNEIINYHTLNKKIFNKTLQHNSQVSAPLLNFKPYFQQNNQTMFSPTSPKSYERQALFKIVNSHN